MAINATNGQLEWFYGVTVPSGSVSCGQSSIPTAIYSTPLVDGDLVYVGTYGGKVLALNRLARAENLPFPQKRYGEWEWVCPGANGGSSAIVADLTMDEDAIYISSSNGRVYSLSKQFGDLNWESEILSRKIWTSPVIQGEALYVATFEGHIYALSPKTGDMLPWSFQSKSGFVSRPVVYEDTIYVGSFDNHLYAIKIGANEPLWSFSGKKWFWSASLVHEGVVYAGSLDGGIYAFDAKTGEQLWRFDCESPIVVSPVLVENWLVIASESGDIYIVNPETGSGERVEGPENSNRPTVNGRIRASLCAHDGVVYIHTQNDSLFSFDIEQRKVIKLFPQANSKS